VQCKVVAGAEIVAVAADLAGRCKVVADHRGERLPHGLAQIYPSLLSPARLGEQAARRTASSVGMSTPIVCSWRVAAVDEASASRSRTEHMFWCWPGMPATTA
jgi:hypothetical protein